MAPVLLSTLHSSSNQDNVIEIEKTGASDGTPILDIKPFIAGYDTAEDARVAEWLKKSGR